MKRLIKLLLLFSCISIPMANAAGLAGIEVEDSIKLENGDNLILNGMGLREKLWIDVYVGSFYLPAKTNNIAEILGKPSAFRIQLDFIYSEVSSENLISAWKEGFEKNQTDQNLNILKTRIERFYQFFEDSALAGDQYMLDHIPGTGTQISKNNALLGTIEGGDFRNALLEIWLGNSPADKQLKKGMLGIN